MQINSTKPAVLSTYGKSRSLGLRDFDEWCMGVWFFLRAESDGNPFFGTPRPGPGPSLGCPCSVRSLIGTVVHGPVLSSGRPGSACSSYGSGSTWLRFLMAPVPLGPGSTRSRSLTALAPLGSGSSWLRFLMAPALLGSGSSWLRFHLALAPLGSGSSWSRLLMAPVPHPPPTVISG